MNPNEIIPWMDNKEIDLVLKYLNQKPNSTMLEWGCGGSTLLFPKHTVPASSTILSASVYVIVPISLPELDPSCAYWAKLRVGTSDATDNLVCWDIFLIK